MKRFVIAVVIATSASLALAQAPGDGGLVPHGRHAGLEQLGAKLNLTEDQKQQLKDIRTADQASNKQLYADFHAKLQELRTLKQSNDPRFDSVKEELKAMRPSMQAARKAHRESMLSVLTPEQRDELSSLRQAHRAMRQSRHVQRAVARHLNLTEEQRAQLKQLHQTSKATNGSLFADVHAKRQELRALTRANDPRAAEVKASLDALRPQIAAAREQRRTAFLSVLTTEQRSKIDQWKALHQSKQNSGVRGRRRAS